MNKLFIIIAFLAIMVPAAMAFPGEPVYKATEATTKGYSVFSEDSRSNSAERKSIAVRIKNKMSDTEQAIRSETYLMSEALSQNLLELTAVESSRLENNKSIACLLRDSLPNKVELDMLLPTYLGEHASSSSQLPKVTLELELAQLPQSKH